MACFPAAFSSTGPPHQALARRIRFQAGDVSPVLTRVLTQKDAVTSEHQQDALVSAEERALLNLHRSTLRLPGRTLVLRHEQTGLSPQVYDIAEADRDPCQRIRVRDSRPVLTVAVPLMQVLIELTP